MGLRKSGQFATLIMNHFTSVKVLFQAKKKKKIQGSMFSMKQTEVDDF